MSLNVQNACLGRGGVARRAADVRAARSRRRPARNSAAARQL